MNRDHELGPDFEDNVVSFPFGSSDKVSKMPSHMIDLSDPLEELLNEFADWEIDEEDYEDLSQIQDVAPAISYQFDHCTDDIHLMKEQLNLLEDITKRLKFYLDEVDLFTPYLKK